MPTQRRRGHGRGVRQQRGAPAGARGAVRRTGRRDGTEYLVRERAMPAPAAGVRRSEMEHTVTRDGVVVAHLVKPFDLLRIEPQLIAAQLTAAGFTAIDLRDPSGSRAMTATDTGYLVRARA